MLGFPDLTMGNSVSQADDQGGCDSSDSDILDTAVLNPFRSKASTLAVMSQNESAVDCNVDAAVSSSQAFRISLIGSAELTKIQKHLDLYEMISLIFLLADDFNDALDVMLKTTKNSGECILFLSAYTQSIESTKKVIEALCIIQNYEVLQVLGYEKSKLYTHFLPMSYHVTVDIKKVRKLCYRVIENLTPEVEHDLVDLIKQDLQEKYGCLMSCYSFLEMNLAYLFHIDYITDSDLSNLVKHFKALELDQYVDMFNSNKIVKVTPGMSVTPLYKSPNYGRSQLNTDKSTAGNENAIASTSMPSMHRKPSISNQSNVYPMDERNPGIVLIIENINFWEDASSTYKHLVIQSETGLEEREGSTQDSTRLCDIFTRFGFKIIHKTDQTHTEMLDLVTNVSHNEIKSYHSSFILIMLSHGRENQIIGCNCVPLDVNDIKKSINSKVLEEKPKILIFQACQGNDFLKLQSDDLATDGVTPKQTAQIPWQKHILDFWSAVPGYVSFRHKRKGSWMIQTLCDVLERQEIESFIDICAEVNRILGKRRVEFLKHEVNVMITPANTTLDKRFILPRLRLD